MTKEQATALVLGCMREVVNTNERFAREQQENDAYLGGPVFVRAPRRLSEAEVCEIIERRLEALPDAAQAAETERTAIVDWLQKEAVTRAHIAQSVIREMAGLIEIKYHHRTK